MSVIVLVVDDDADIRNFAAETLRGAGFDVLEACDAPSAIALLGEYPAIEVLFTDIEMPGIDGFGLAVIAVLLTSRVHVLYSSGRAGLDDNRCERTIPAEMLSKPYRGSQLVAAVQNAYRSPLAVRGGAGLLPVIPTLAA
jgi:CheY-like chemotaxis protein